MAMSRDDVRNIFPEATDAQITAFLNAHHNDVNAENAAAAQKAADNAQTAYNAALESLKSAQQQASDSEAAKDSIEARFQQLQQSFESMKAENAQLQNKATAIAAFTAAGVASEQFEPLLAGIVTENAEKTAALTTGIIAAINSAKETAKGEAKRELIRGTPPPAAGTPPVPDTPETAMRKAMQAGDMLGIIRAADSAVPTT